jgi:hypothetical protein
MVAALDHLKYLAQTNRGGLTSAELETREDYVEFLRGQEWPMPGRTLLWQPIDPEFRKAISDALEASRIVMREAGFAPSEEMTKSFETESPLLEIDRKVTAHGLPERERKELTRDERELENLVQYVYEPPAAARNIREIAALPKDARDKRLSRMLKESARFVSQLDYTWDELQFVPDIAFLAGYIASVPSELQGRVAERYIGDESKDFFPRMHWNELARVPNPVLLMACLPRMKETAERQAKEFSEILREEGYTLEDADNNKLSGSAIMRMRSRHPDRYSLLRRRRIRIGQAEGLAETERVKKLLDLSGLTIEQVGQYTIPQLVARILSSISSQQAQSLVDETPKFKAYLRRTEDEDLKALIRQKGLDLDVD